MKELPEKILLVAAGAAAGALGYLAWKNRDQLKPLVEQTIAQGQELVEEYLQPKNQPDSSGQTKE